MNTPVRHLLETADRLVIGASAAMGVGACRGAAFALRIALEIAVGEALRVGMSDTLPRSMRARLLCLRAYTSAETAHRARAVWVLLCLGCHYHRYEIGPTREQVREWYREVDLVIRALRG